MPLTVEGKHPISQGLGRQSPDLLKWKDSLRQQKGYPESSTLRRSGSFSSLKKSGGKLAANFSTMSGKLNRSASDLEKIESEYIKNLQQQVYYLELEANYLREQARKATDIQPQMSVEAERMLSKLRQMQEEVDGLQLELKRRENSVDMVNTEKERLQARLKAEEDSHQREKRLLLDEVVQLKKEKDFLDREGARKDSQILQARQELDKATAALKSFETKMELLRNQLDQKTEQHKMTQSALEEKRTELLKLETALREVEDKYYSSTATIQDKVVQDLRDEMRMLKTKVKEAEMSADQDRYLRNKLSDDSSHLVKENALLSQQVLELQKQLEREKSLREGNDSRRSASITEFVVLKDREKQLHFDLEQTKEALRHEQGRCKHYMEQLAKQERLATSSELNASTTRSKLSELEGYHQSVDSENAALRRDKMLLVDHTADLQNQLELKEKEVLALHGRLGGLDSQMQELEHLKKVQSSIHSQKWDEFSRLAESMKNLSQSMATSGSPTPRGSTRLEYS